MICRICNKDLPQSSFYTYSTHRHIHRTECKKCIGKIRKELNRKCRIKRKLYFVKLFGGSCCKCGYNKNYAALDFHHKETEQKDIEITKVWSRTDDVIQVELQKCILLCANCHREEHNPDCWLRD